MSYSLSIIFCIIDLSSSSSDCCSDRILCCSFINPPGFVAATVALAFGLAASSFFPAILLGIFSKRINKEGAISGMLVGVTLMLFYMLKFKFGWFGGGNKADWWFGISPEGFGTVAMVFNFIVTLLVSAKTPAPSKDIQELVVNIRKP